MIAVIQRVKEAHVSVEGQIVGRVAQGLVILLGVFKNDSEQDTAFLADKIAGLRIFGDAQQKMNLSIKDVDGAALVISQFTLWVIGAKVAVPALARPPIHKPGGDCMKNSSQIYKLPGYHPSKAFSAR